MADKPYFLPTLEDFNTSIYNFSTEGDFLSEGFSDSMGAFFIYSQEDPDYWGD